MLNKVNQKEDIKNFLKPNEDLVDFFELLLQIDKKKNPELYKIEEDKKYD